MTPETINTVAQLGGTVFVVCVFVAYLMHKNGKSEKAMGRVTDTLEALAKNQERHTRVLINVSKAHGLKGDSDELISS